MDLINKYRPQDFVSVIGQEATVRSLQSVVRAGTAHQFLFTGPSGVGKTTLARIVARELGCAPGQIYEVNAASNTGVDDMRGVAETTRYPGLGTSQNMAIILDECFAPDTAVRTARGWKPIAAIVVGDYVHSACGWRRVRRVFRTPIKVASTVRLRLSTGRDIVCTREHLFLTSRGWVSAASLRPTEELIHGRVSPDLLKVWDAVLGDGARGAILRRVPIANLSCLQSGLRGTDEQQKDYLLAGLWELAGRSEATGAAFPGARSQSSSRLGALAQTKSRSVENDVCGQSTPYAGSESDARFFCAREDVKDESSSWNFARLAGREGWERQADAAADQVVKSLGLEDGVFYRDAADEKAKIISAQLQGRHCISEASHCNRSRRQGAPDTACQGFGCEEDGLAGATWVVSVESYECGNRSGSGVRSASHQDFYDLEVEGHPSYEVEGVIVHNCHRLSKQAWESLLKHLEEPPAYAFWFLCTTEPSKVPTTGLTRVVRYDLKPVPRDDIYKLLGDIVDAEKFKATDDVLWLLAGKAQGSPRQALSYLAACVDCITVDEAAEVIAVATDATTGIIDLCRFLLKGSGRWEDAAVLIAPLRTMGGEAARAVIADYMTKVLLGAKSENEAVRILAVLEHFSEPFQAWDALTPLVVAVGRALYAGRN